MNALSPKGLLNPSHLDLTMTSGHTFRFHEILVRPASGRPGIYLYTGSQSALGPTEWLYIGQTSDCNDRPIGSHEKHNALSRHYGVRLWFCEMPNFLGRSLVERELIGLLKPRLNKNLL